MEVLGILRVKIIDFGTFLSIADPASSAHIIYVIVIVGGTIRRAA